ncbi:MAG: radical SAM protein [Deltaproteobacteria bacterium]|nr:radical SAM protein [Deltaproteobacteria bacterium]
MKILLSSVFKPYAVDDEYGRKENVMELFHNQVTREQGVFSLRMNHPSAGLHLMAENLSVPTMVLDFPSLEEFEREVSKGYDWVGISFIVPNLKKAQHMARRVRELSPMTRIVLGGHGTSIPDVDRLVPHDAICRGDGVRFMRELIGDPVERPISHPAVPSAFNRRFLGVPISGTSAFLMPGNGCPNACDFCCTTHYFKHEYVPFLETGREVFEVLCRLERELGANEFFVLDENFLKYPKRARDLVELMERHDKQWSFGVFSSAESIRQYGLDFLTRLGIFFLWVGVESKRHVYAKNKGADVRGLVRSLRERGICVLTSGILFFDHHTKANIDEDIDYLVGLEADFVQFMQLGPLPGTQLYKRIDREGRLRKDVPYEEWHGQHRIWFDHPEFKAEETEEILKGAFLRDFLTNGPSVLRMNETYLMGYRSLSGVSDRFLLGRRALLRRRLVEHRPGVPVLARLSPTAALRGRARRLEAELARELGPISLADQARSTAATLFALSEAARLKLLGSARQPRTIWTPYRMEVAPAWVRARSEVQAKLLRLDESVGLRPAWGGLMRALGA